MSFLCSEATVLRPHLKLARGCMHLNRDWGMLPRPPRPDRLEEVNGMKGQKRALQLVSI
jgi:hypothetical protein